MSPERIKVLHLITSLDTGGAEVALSRITTAMDQNRFENVVVSLTTAGPLSVKLGAKGIKVSNIGMSRSLPTPLAFWRLYQMLRTEQPTILQTWLYHSDFLGLLAGRAAGISTIAWNVRCAQTDARYKRGVNGVLVWLLARLSRYPDVIVANSNAGREEHVALGYQSKRWKVLENGFDLTEFKPEPEAGIRMRHALGLSDNTILVGLIARYDPLKNHETFLRAAADLHSTNPEVHFLLAGENIDSTNRILNPLIDKLGIRERVHLLGHRDDVAALTASLDVATCCSLGEGFPNVVGEAMACAVPCVVTDVGDAARIVGETGIVVPPADAQALSQGWRDMIAKGTAGRAADGVRCLARVKKNFSLTRCVERYQDLYKHLSDLQKH